MNKTIVSMLIVLILVVGYFYFRPNKVNDVQKIDVSQIENPGVKIDESVGSASLKEFTMMSWMDKVDGKMAAHFSLNEIKVKKGDTVKIHITNTAGTHDFILDEFGIDMETPLDQTVVVEFVADKVGTFEYYCGKYNHRALGQRGNLIVE